MFLNIDIRTVIVLLGITSIIQVIALLLQYLINKSSRSGVWWLIGFAFIAIGLALSLLRDVINVKVITIFAANIFQILGPIFIYIGVMRFLSKEENRSFVFWVLLVWLPFFFYFTFVNDQINLRSIISSVALAAIAFMTARGFFFNKFSSINSSATFTMVAFLIQGCFWIFRIIELLTFSPVYDYFSPTLVQAVTYIFVLIISLVETFGLIIMVNQRMNTEMKEAKNHFEAIFNTSPDSMLISRLNDGVVINANEGFTVMTGFTHAEVIGKSTLDVNIWYHPADRQKLTTVLKAKGFCEDLEAVFQRKDGSLLTGLLSGKVIELNGSPHIISVTRDITERKIAEDALRKSESKIRAITDSAQDAILMMDPKGVVSYWNPAAERILGYTSAEAIGQNLHQWIVPKRYHEAHNAAFPIFQKTGLGDAIGKTSEVYARRKDGSEIPVQLSLASLEIQREYYAVGIISDITERKNLEEKLMHQATTDELTGISNRRHFLELTSTELKRSIRFNHPLALLMMDLDHLKRINDTYGHAIGDQALIAFAKICRENIREIDIVARFGGDEFVLLLPETNCERAFEVAERLRLTLTAQPIDFANTPVMVTSSVGVSCLKSDKETLETLLARADTSLYQAKEAGRNCVICWAGEENDSDPNHAD